MGPPSVGEITVLLNRASAGERESYERLADLVYGELRKMASHIMVSERQGHTLQPTVIAGDAYLKLIDQKNHTWQNRAHFFAAAAKAMRLILVDYGRRRQSQKRAGSLRRVNLGEAANVALDSGEDMLSLDEALTRLEQIDGRQSRIVELRYFGGLTEEEVAEVLHISLRTVKREWAVARAWLYAELTAHASESAVPNG